MYKLLLCWRYLLTRRLALACIISVMLGVATLIVVNSVMSGFSTKLKDRLHGLLSDVILSSFDYEGFADPEGKMQRIWNTPGLGDKIEAMAPAIEILGLIQITCRGQQIAPRAVHIIGIKPEARARMGNFKEFLLDPRNQQNPSFDLSPEARQWHEKYWPSLPDVPFMQVPSAPGEAPPPVMPQPQPKSCAGIFVGYAIGTIRVPDPETGQPKEFKLLQPGDEVVLYTTSGQRLSPVYDNVVVADFIKTEMSEYDSSYVYVPLEWLQQLRTMPNRATSLQIKLKDYADARQVVDTLRTMFPHDLNYAVETWEDKQGPLLAAISIEKGILNILLFLIIGVAGFGILAIFAMIVVEKTRDIGILKALGASNGGVMKIFLGYGLLLGLLGAVLGTILGLEITTHINGIEKWLAWCTGHEIFDRNIYYFNQIPTDIQAVSVTLVNIGAVAIAVLFSVLPALKAAMLHPVRALRYE
jgi:lipoprotein-releasing system permease protein